MSAIRLQEAIGCRLLTIIAHMFIVSINKFIHFPKDIFLFNRERSNTAETVSNYRLTISMKGQGNTEPRSGTYYFERGARIYVSALPASGWKFDGWSGDLSGSDSTRILTMNSDRRITACFYNTSHKLTVKVNGHGIVRQFPDAVVYNHGTIVRISTLPGDGWRFDGWSGDISGSHSPHIFSMNSNQRIIANFLPIHTLTISTAGQGTTEPRSGTYSYDRGTRIYVSALPESGWKLDQWSGDISGRDSTRILIINSDKNITACFQPQYRFNKPVTPTISYIANRNSREIHSSDCYWVTKMNETNKIPLYDFSDISEMIKNRGYNGCFYCLRRYDRDTLTSDVVLRNLEADSAGKQLG